jgi:pilus assembly protein CpaE
MDTTTLILLIQEPSADGYLRGVLLNSAGDRFRVQSVDQVPMALARIGGGGIDLVILDLSLSQHPEIERLDSFLKLRSAARQVPVIVVYGSEDDSLILRALRAGDAEHLPKTYLPKTSCHTDLVPLVRAAISQRFTTVEGRPNLVSAPRKAGLLTTFLGGKGGVGTTTVALNVACALAQWGKIILTEPRPMFGTLSRYFRPHRLTCNIARWLQMDSHIIEPAEIEAGLWPCKEIPDLNILFGPQTVDECQEITPSSASAVLDALSSLADYVVLDLFPTLSAGNRAIIQRSDALVLVVERDPLCIASARPILETIQSANVIPRLIGSVIVNRTPLAAPMDLSEIEMQLGIPTLAVIPPAADLCLAAQKARVPLCLFDPDSLAARSLGNLADALVMPSRKPARAS